MYMKYGLYMIVLDDLICGVKFFLLLCSVALMTVFDLCLYIAAIAFVTVYIDSLRIMVICSNSCN